MANITLTEISSILLNSFFACVEAFFLFALYSESKKTKLYSFACTFWFFPIVSLRSFFSFLIDKGTDSAFPFFAICELILALWPLQYSGYFKRKRFNSQFLAYCTNSFNPFLYASVMLARFIINKFSLSVFSIESVLIERILCIIGILSFVPIIKKFIVPKIDKIPSFIIKALVIIIPVSQVFPIMTNGRLGSVFDSNEFYIIFAGFGLSHTIAGISIYKYSQEYAQRQKLEAAMSFEQNKINYFDVIEQHSKKISKLSHDINNHLRTIQALAQSNKANEVIQYSDELFSLYSGNMKAYCRNSTVNALLLYYDTLSENSGVQYIARADVNEDVPMSQVELVSILSNVLDNAFEACETVSEASKKVDVTIDTKNNAFVFICKNSFDGKINVKNKKLITRKKDASNHGLGTDIVRDTVERLNGKCVFEHNDTTFTTTIYIPT